MGTWWLQFVSRSTKILFKVEVYIALVDANTLHFSNVYVAECDTNANLVMGLHDTCLLETSCPHQLTEQSDRTGDEGQSRPEGHFKPRKRWFGVAPEIRREGSLYASDAAHTVRLIHNIGIITCAIAMFILACKQIEVD
jgi:hypothetical protein